MSAARSGRDVWSEDVRVRVYELSLVSVCDKLHVYESVMVCVEDGVSRRSV
jgi:hypothetical protein